MLTELRIQTRVGLSQSESFFGIEEPVIIDCTPLFAYDFDDQLDDQNIKQDKIKFFYSRET